MIKNTFLPLKLRQKTVTVYADCRVLVFDPILASEPGYDAEQHAPYLAISDLPFDLVADLSEFERRVLLERELHFTRGALDTSKRRLVEVSVLLIAVFLTLLGLLLHLY